MKFGRYLQDTQTTEWKRAYIDYRGLKKLIAAIRISQEVSDSSPIYSSSSVRRSRQRPFATNIGSAANEGENDWRFQDVIDISPHSAHDQDIHSMDACRPAIHAMVYDSAEDALRTPGKTTSRIRASFITPRASKRRTRGLSFMNRWSEAPWKTSPLAGLPLFELYEHLNPLQLKFFTTLDAELDKIDLFYASKEGELQVRTRALNEQFKELNDHRHTIHKIQSTKTSIWNIAVKRTLRFKSANDIDTIAESVDVRSDLHSSKKIASPAGGEARRAIAHSSNREDYLYAKKTLRKAVVEHYRALEALLNYRVLNVTGFRKALKKFEKVTKIPAQQQYMIEKIDRSTLASDKSVRLMMRGMEERFSESFLRGNEKRAREYLRGSIRATTHHFSTFRSGFYLGLSLPPLVSGLYLSFQPYVREQINGWDALLYVYGIFFIPAVFSVLIVLNLMVCDHFRINYVFIFELNTRNRIDYRNYLELPSLFFTTLCYAFWLSFSRIGSPILAPSYWLLVWLGLVVVLILNPLPYWFRASRVWFLKTLGRVLLSGTRPVEFADFWLADQLCSFSFSLSNLIVFACTYALKFGKFGSEWQQCDSSSRLWPAQFVMTSLPLLFRVAQSFRRYSESGLSSHLVNAGKYATGIFNYLMYFLWRALDNRSGLMAAWCIVNTAYSIYTSFWDVYMDWSLFKSQSRYPLLREDLVYSSCIPYYFAIMSNTLIRFAWVIYLPNQGLDFKLRTFIVAFLEMLRRWQWNFCESSIMILY
ncbi:hypothetical protein AX15_001415 [Amanita polypyramis BW_CC]|nr:hypothetical protein AX15_001415 [Amanita polypyramis BW_CC]